MRLSRDEAKALGIAHMWPDDRPPSQAPPPDGMTKLERSFRDTVLAPALGRGELVAWWREPIKLRLAGRTFYTPDWLVARHEGRYDPELGGRSLIFTFIETKGAFFREDAKVKTKVAADLYPHFGWLLVFKDKRGWDVRRIDSRGIGEAPISVPWIHGNGG